MSDKKLNTTHTTRLTTDVPIGNFKTMMNYAYAKDDRVKLRYGNGENGIDLCEYIAEVAAEKYCEHTAEEVMGGACMECDCPFAVLFTVATQAAELRARLKEYEDAEESGTLIKTPCKVGDKVYTTLYFDEIIEAVVIEWSHHCLGVTSYIAEHPREENLPLEVRFSNRNIGKTVFLTREEAEKALKEKNDG